MKFLLLSVITALPMIMGCFFANYALAETQTVPASDFAIAVQTGLQSLATNPAAQSQQQEIKNQDYKSTWDEFGINILIDGNMPPAEVKKQIAQDIIQSVETAQNYNKQEVNYLQAAQITPEQVQSAESSIGVDIPPSQTVDPNPSFNANHDVNISPADTSIQDNTEMNTTETNSSTQKASTSINNTLINILESGSSTEANISIQTIASSTLDINASTSTTDTNASSSEDIIYDAILQGEQTHPADLAPVNNTTTPSPSSTDNTSPTPIDNTPSPSVDDTPTTP